MLDIINSKIDLLDIYTLMISVIALIATLRKKEFGKFYFVIKNVEKNEIWLQVVKSDLYDLQIICEPYKKMSCRINILKESDTKESVIAFPDEEKPIVHFALLKVNTIIKFKGCYSSKIHIQYKDKFNNLYRQEMDQNKIAERKHVNIWNLTFVGS